jgi:hypothetical protein
VCNRVGQETYLDTRTAQDLADADHQVAFSCHVLPPPVDAKVKAAVNFENEAAPAQEGPGRIEVSAPASIVMAELLLVRRHQPMRAAQADKVDLGEGVGTSFDVGEGAAQEADVPDLTSFVERVAKIGYARQPLLDPRRQETARGSGSGEPGCRVDE